MPAWGRPSCVSCVPVASRRSCSPLPRPPSKPTVLLTFLSHLVQVALWGMVLVWCGEFQQFGVAFYASLGNYTTVGTGTVVMSESWRLLAPLETMNGVLMAGMTTSVLFAVLPGVLQSHPQSLDQNRVPRLP